jgi:hypothetical protein
MREFFAQGWETGPYFRTQRTVIDVAIDNNSPRLSSPHTHTASCATG